MINVTIFPEEPNQAALVTLRSLVRLLEENEKPYAAASSSGFTSKDVPLMADTEEALQALADLCSEVKCEPEYSFLRETPDFKRIESRLLEYPMRITRQISSRLYARSLGK